MTPTQDASLEVVKSTYKQVQTRVVPLTLIDTDTIVVMLPARAQDPP